MQLLRNDLKNVAEQNSIDCENNGKIIKVAITGGIGSGKSTICKILAEWGYPVFSCDEIYSELLKNRDFCFGLELLFPNSTKDGFADKNALKNIVFSDKEALNKLNAYTHPAIINRLLEKINALNVDGKAKIVFAEVPLLFEERYDALFDKILVVLRREKERIKSVMTRDKCEEGLIRKKMEAQFDYSLSKTKENYPSFEKISFIENDGNIEKLETSIRKSVEII